ncbi:polysaccharide biosynthesis/export family protein, partial [bacterium]|nr:polysaccharide biosynthesis/export family protein [bacterium]
NKMFFVVIGVVFFCRFLIIPCMSIALDQPILDEEESIDSNDNRNRRKEASTYLIGPEDVLNISVWGNKDLNHQVFVRPDGKISFPLIGDVLAMGRSPEDIREEITRKLNPFVPDAVVTLMVVSINSFKIYIIGNTARQGEFVVGRKINVLQALSMAGGFNDFASTKNISIIRTKNNEQIKIQFNYKEITEGKNLDQNIYLQPGDVIVVP